MVTIEQIVVAIPLLKSAAHMRRLRDLCQDAASQLLRRRLYAPPDHRVFARGLPDFCQPCTSDHRWHWHLRQRGAAPVLGRRHGESRISSCLRVMPHGGVADRLGGRGERHALILPVSGNEWYTLVLLSKLKCRAPHTPLTMRSCKPVHLIATYILALFPLGAEPLPVPRVSQDRCSAPGQRTVENA